MKGPFHDKWYLQKTKARSEALGVLANSLKREFALAANLTVDYLYWFLTREVGKQTRVEPGTVSGVEKGWLQSH